MMKKVLLLAGFSWIVPGPAMGASACVASTYNNYIGTSCTINGFLFSMFDFGASASPGPAVSANAIMVTPISTSGLAGFQFSGIWSAGQPNATSSLQLSYKASMADGQPRMNRAAAGISSSFRGAGQTTLSFDYCLNQPLAGCPAGRSGQVAVTNPPPGFGDGDYFVGASDIFVYNAITIAAGPNGAADASQVINAFGTPEPVPLLLLGSGLVAMGWLRRRRLAQAFHL